jgi:hypothetical protein
LGSTSSHHSKASISAARCPLSKEISSVSPEGVLRSHIDARIRTFSNAYEDFRTLLESNPRNLTVELYFHCFSEQDIQADSTRKRVSIAFPQAKSGAKREQILQYSSHSVVAESSTDRLIGMVYI